MRKLLIFAFLCVVLFSFADAQRRNRNRGRGKKGPNCHLKELDKCMEKMEALGKRPQASDIITTDAGITELCT